MATIVAPPWEEQPTGGGIADAPTDGKTYGRKDAAWEEVVSAIELVEDDITSTLIQQAASLIQTQGIIVKFHGYGD